VPGRTPGTLRVVSWNVLWSGIVDPALEGPFRRVLQALDPDVVALQEILEHAEARDLLQAWLPGGSWEYAGFSDRVTLSRWPRDWDWPGSFEPLESRFTVSAIVLPGGGRLAVLNAHLSFGDQDEARQREADSFAAFLREVRTPGTPSSLPPGTPFLLVGDLNLVGDRTQLETLLTGAIQDTATFGPPSPPDWDGSALADALPLVAGDAQAVTWKAPSSSYWPGRLDFVIYPDSALTLHASFVLDTGRLPPGELSAHGLEATDTAVASDHLPVIADFLLSP
ncbi:MAG: endonuclease/exonuclease/phosphatase family protein, partial [Deltaproteobacteria bacterium]|nr:endonuclease/exonuclease/phosphatase family protein [Deltaproteobacteria bacterium]